MRVVVVGGTGFLGRAVVERLRDHDVTVFHRSCDDPSHVHDDRLNIGAHRLRADVVIDLYALTRDDARTLVEARIAPRLIVISSGDVYRQYDLLRGAEQGPSDPLPLTERSPLRTHFHPYGTTYEKIFVEREAAGSTILRLPALYGPGDPKKRMTSWSRTMSRAYADFRWTHGYVENVADAVVLAIDERAAGSIYNVGEPDAPAQREWAAMCGVEVEIVEQPETYDWRHHLIMDSTAIREELGYVERVPRAAAIAATLGG